METLYLRYRDNHEIMRFDPQLANHPNMEVVTEREAYPERFADKSVIEVVKNNTLNEVVSDLQIPDDAIEAPYKEAPELIADASRAFGGAAARKIETAQATPTGFKGLLEEL